MSGGKADLRRWALRRRAALGEAKRRAFSDAIAARVLASEAFAKARTVMGYADFKDEVHTGAILSETMRLGKRCILPVCGEGRAIIPIAYDGGPFRLGRFGVPEPCGVAVDPWEIDLVLVPGVLFSQKGDRLGYGVGYYDRFLPRTGALRMGLAFSVQIVEEIAAESHDARMHAMATEEELIKVIEKEESIVAGAG